MSNEYVHIGAIGEGPHARSARAQIDGLLAAIARQGRRPTAGEGDYISTLEMSYEYYMSKGE